MIIGKTKKLLAKIEENLFASDKFHSLTINKKLTSTDPTTMPSSWKTIHFKRYPRFKKVYFNNIKIRITELRTILYKRRSVRHFTRSPISKSDLYYLLSSAAGLIYQDESVDNSRRPYPSAGARYPLEIYTVLENCEDVEKGVYHYNIRENVLELLVKGDFSEWLVEITGGQKWVKESAVVFIITGVMDRMRVKYGDRGYRYTLLEAGHLGQNISILATELGLGCCAIGGYVDSEVNKLLDIQLQKEFALYLFAVGKI